MYRMAAGMFRGTGYEKYPVPFPYVSRFAGKAYNFNLNVQTGMRFAVGLTVVSIRSRNHFVIYYVYPTG